ncbi:MAG TPA: DNA replication/repair protein RecF [Alphaproteobacteria bacterium]|nr:DNA replication/repair protein RecF [Alphaproteobacteria bacterium]
MKTTQLITSYETDHPTRGVERLNLSHFRCYEIFSVSLDLKPVVLTGPNGAGKTNLLEALSFLIPGRGVRRARLSEVSRQTSSDPWAVSVQLRDRETSMQIGTGLDPEVPESERRVTRINGEKAKSQSILAEWVSMVWLTPQMDRLFLEGPQGRRRFLDRLVYGFDPGHAQRLSRYEKALKERSLLLRQRRFDRHWIEGLEESLVNDGIAITIARREVVGQLSSVLKNQETIFPRAELSLEGGLEDLLNKHSLLEVEEDVRRLLAESREQDSLTGRTSFGPHRSDLLTVFPEKNQAAAFCSTGEQKALLLSIVMASAQLLSVRTGAIPLLLLDEVVAHLDERRRSALFDAILKLKIQAWLTGTDASMFKELQGSAQFLSLKEARLVSKT